MSESLEIIGSSWLKLPATSSRSGDKRRGRTWGGGGGTCHECRKSNAAKGPLFVAESCQAQLRGGRKHSYHLACLQQYGSLKDSEVCPACSGACVCLGGSSAHPCKVSMRPSVSTRKERRRVQVSGADSGADSDSRSWPSETGDQVQSPAGTVTGATSVPDTTVLRRSLRTAGTHRSYAFAGNDEEGEPDVERSDSIVSSLMSSAGDSFTVGAAVAASGWSVTAAGANVSAAPGCGSTVPLFCSSRADTNDACMPAGAAAAAADVDTSAPVLPPQGPKAVDLLMGDLDLSPTLLQMLNDIAPRSVLEMCLTEETLRSKGEDLAAAQLRLRQMQQHEMAIEATAQMPPPLCPTPGPVWATSMPPAFPGPAPVQFQFAPVASSFLFGQQQQPQSALQPMQNQPFWSS